MCVCVCMCACVCACVAGWLLTLNGMWSHDVWLFVAAISNQFLVCFHTHFRIWVRQAYVLIEKNGNIVLVKLSPLNVLYVSFNFVIFACLLYIVKWRISISMLFYVFLYFRTIFELAFISVFSAFIFVFVYFFIIVFAFVVVIMNITVKFN